MTNLLNTPEYRSAVQSGSSFTYGRALYLCIMRGDTFADYGLDEYVDRYRTLYTEDGESLDLSDRAIAEVLDISVLQELAEQAIEVEEEQ